MIQLTHYRHGDMLRDEVVVVAGRGMEHRLEGGRRVADVAGDGGSRSSWLEVAGDLHTLLLACAREPLELRLHGQGAPVKDGAGPALLQAAREMRDAAAARTAPLLVRASGTIAGPLLSVALGADILAVDETLCGRLLEWQDRPLPLPGDLILLCERLGRARTLEVAFTGGPVTGAELRERGGAIALGQADANFAAASGGSAVAQSAARLLLRQGRPGRAAAEALERAAFALCFAHEDRAEGVSAFLEKRSPRFPRD